VTDDEAPRPCALCGATWGDVRREIEERTYHF
jgi:hypothetical protein